jgi:hypothetical protein
MVLVTVRDALNQLSCPLFVGGTARAVLLAGAGMEDDALLRNGQALGVEGGEPWWWRGCCRGEVHHYAVVVQEGDDAVQPVEVVLARVGFQLCPGEDP